jgi:prephenate dehydrogenase/chorismate mutase
VAGSFCGEEGAAMDNTIEKRRAEIDAIDDELLGLLNRRARLAAEIGLVKKRRHAPLCDPDRERGVLARVCEASDGPLDEQAVKKIFKTIIDESRRIQSIEKVTKPASQIATPKWNRATIVGCGLMGASFALALRKSGTCRRIAGWDTAEEVLEEALQRGIIDGVDSSFARSAVSQSDLIYLAMPVGGILKFLVECGPQIKLGALVTDAGSTKVEICRAAREHLPAGVVFAGGHPIAGSENSGLVHSDAQLFRDALYVLIKDREETDQLRAFSETLKIIGARVTLMTPDAHDRALARVSHLPQLVSSTLAATLQSEDAPSLLDLSGSGWRDMTRLAESSWSMWRGILESNHGQIVAAVDVFAQKLDSVREELRARSEGKRREMSQTEQVFTDANRLAKAANRRSHRAGVIRS